MRGARVRHERHPRAGGRPLAMRLATGATCLLAGLLIATSAVNAQGGDLRPNRNTDLIDLVADQADRNTQLTRRLGELRTEVDGLSRGASEDPPLAAELDAAADVAGARAVQGPAVSVSLSDAPIDVEPTGVDDEFLVVHQQDIQAVADALWAGGAEAMTIQGQRVTARTGIKCVGNTVVLHGIPYAPPYVLVAIGDQARLEASLTASRSLAIYRQYADAYGLVYQQRRLPNAVLPAYTGSVDVQYAEPHR